MSFVVPTRRRSGRQMKERTFFMLTCRQFQSCCLCRPCPYSDARQLESDIAGVTIDGKDIPVRVRIYDSLFVPIFLVACLTGNYRCVQRDCVRPIRDAVHGDVEASAGMYSWVV